MFLLAAQASPSAPLGPTPGKSDVVVTGERLRKLRLATSLEDGKLIGCSVAVSSGDAQIDFVACNMMRQCIAEGATTAEPLANCVDARISDYIKQDAATVAARTE
jgi:hypothetical protein